MLRHSEATSGAFREKWKTVGGQRTPSETHRCVINDFFLISPIPHPLTGGVDDFGTDEVSQLTADQVKNCKP